MSGIVPSFVTEPDTTHVWTFRRAGSAVWTGKPATVWKAAIFALVTHYYGTLQYACLAALFNAVRYAPPPLATASFNAAQALAVIGGPGGLGKAARVFAGNCGAAGGGAGCRLDDGGGLLVIGTVVVVLVLRF